MNTNTTTENIHIHRRKPFNGYHRIVSSLAKKYTPDDGKILDIGCGMGHVLELLDQSESSYSLTASDAYQVCLDETKKRVNKAEIRLQSPTSINEAELGSGYDTIVMSHVLEHMLRPADAIKDAMELLNDNGHLVVAVPNPVRPTVFMGNIRRKHYVNKGHVCAWDRSHWINFLENILELNVIEYANDEVYIFPGGLSRRVRVIKSIEWGFGKMIPWWSFSNIAVISK